MHPGPHLHMAALKPLYTSQAPEFASSFTAEARARTSAAAATMLSRNLILILTKEQKIILDDYSGSLLIKKTRGGEIKMNCFHLVDYEHIILVLAKGILCTVIGCYSDIVKIAYGDSIGNPQIVSRTVIHYIIR